MLDIIDHDELEEGIRNFHDFMDGFASCVKRQVVGLKGMRDQSIITEGEALEALSDIVRRLRRYQPEMVLAVRSGGRYSSRLT